MGLSDGRNGEHFEQLAGGGFFFDYWEEKNVPDKLAQGSKTLIVRITTLSASGRNSAFANKAHGDNREKLGRDSTKSPVSGSCDPCLDFAHLSKGRQIAGITEGVGRTPKTPGCSRFEEKPPELQQDATIRTRWGSDPLQFCRPTKIPRQDTHLNRSCLDKSNRRPTCLLPEELAAAREGGGGELQDIEPTFGQSLRVTKTRLTIGVPTPSHRTVPARAWSEA